MNRAYKILTVLLVILPAIICYDEVISVIIDQLNKYGHVYWNTIVRISRRHGHRIVSLKSAFIIDITIFIVSVVLYIIVITKHNKIIRDINIKINKYCNKFTKKSKYSINNLPNNINMTKFLKPILNRTKIENKSDYIFLKSFILDQIDNISKIINNMTIFQKYILLGADDMQGINICYIANSKSNISHHNIDKFMKLQKINVQKYMLLEIISLKEETNNSLNKRKCKNELILQLVFNQKEILKEIVLEVFLNRNEDNNIKLIENDIINQVGWYYKTIRFHEFNYKEHENNKNCIQHEVKNNIYTFKQILLISSINETLNNNKEFKKKFFETIYK